MALIHGRRAGVRRKSRRAVFVDKDGTLVDDVPYNVDPARITLLPGVGSGLMGLAAADFAIVVVSNQPGVAELRFAVADLQAVEQRIDALLEARGVQVEGYCWCIHARDAGCDCRKPQPGLLHAAARQLRLDLAASWMIGDILDDVEAGNRAGCLSILVDRGGETEWRGGAGRTPYALVHSFDEAAALIRHGDARQRAAQRTAGLSP